MSDYVVEGTVVEFAGTLAGTNSAARWLSVSSEGDAKVVLEVPASEIETVMRLIQAHGKLMKIRCEF